MSAARPLRSGWGLLRRRLAAAPRVALLADFDGTLAPIVVHPQQARLPAGTRRILQRLARRPGLIVGVVSGRPLADLRRRVGLRGLHYLGSHGLEWAGPRGKRGRHFNRNMQSRVRAAARALQAELDGAGGVCIERKPVSVAVHWRNASPGAAARARRALARILGEASHALRLLAGKKVWELLPARSPDRGGGVEALLQHAAVRGAQRPLVVYLGDDVTDEAVFRRLRRGDVGIHVGRGPTRAAYRLGSPRDVARFLSDLEEVLA